MEFPIITGKPNSKCTEPYQQRPSYLSARQDIGPTCMFTSTGNQFTSTIHYVLCWFICVGYVNCHIRLHYCTAGLLFQEAVFVELCHTAIITL